MGQNEVPSINFVLPQVYTDKNLVSFRTRCETNLQCKIWITVHLASEVQGVLRSGEILILKLDLDCAGVLHLEDVPIAGIKLVFPG